MLLSVIVGLPVPFTPVMILWANLICDIPPALALGVDPIEKDILHRKPRDPKVGIFTWKTTVIVLLHGLCMAGITLGLYLFGIYSLGYEASTDVNKSGPARGLAFVGLASIQLIHALLSRSLRRSLLCTRLTIRSRTMAIKWSRLACYSGGNSDPYMFRRVVKVDISMEMV